MIGNFKDWIITEAYYDMGKDINGNKRFVKAPFVKVLFAPDSTSAPDQYFMPTVGGVDLTSQSNVKGETGFGCVTFQNIVIGANELGDFDGHSDDWMGFHAIGFI